MGKKKTQQKQEKTTPAPVDTKAEKKQKKSAAKQQKPKEKKAESKSPAKTKPIKKNQKPAKQQTPAPAPSTQKKPKAPKKEQTNVQIFTPEFYKKLNTFQNYYKEVLELKSSSNNSNLSDELSSVNNRVRELLQGASSKILKDQLVTLEQWIKGEQKKLRNEISNVEHCLEQSQKSLESTKAFSVDEIGNQLKLIKKRISQKQAQLDHYGALLKRSREIYQEESGEKVETKPAGQDNGENNDKEVEEQLDELDDLQ